MHWWEEARGSDESSSVVKLKRTVDWTALSGNGGELVMIAIDSNNMLYRLILRRFDGVQSMEIKDWF